MYIERRMMIHCNDVYVMFLSYEMVWMMSIIEITVL